MEKEILPASAPQKPQKKDVKKKKKKNKSILYGTNKKGKHVNGTTNFARIFVMPFS